MKTTGSLSIYDKKGMTESDKRNFISGLKAILKRIILPISVMPSN
jgi:hypothetical protein